jgi:hypothetical protein
MTWRQKRRCAKGKHAWGFYASADNQFVHHQSHWGPVEDEIIPYYCGHCDAPGNEVARVQVDKYERNIISTECPRIRITTQAVRVPQ